MRRGTIAAVTLMLIAAPFTLFFTLAHFTEIMSPLFSASSQTLMHHTVGGILALICATITLASISVIITHDRLKRFFNQHLEKISAKQFTRIIKNAQFTAAGVTLFVIGAIFLSLYLDLLLNPSSWLTQHSMLLQSLESPALFALIAVSCICMAAGITMMSVGGYHLGNIQACLNFSPISRQNSSPSFVPGNHSSVATSHERSSIVTP